ncbi:hypothetical protein [Candidatus Nephthysia bennettiae]|uniref:hypothetical protein n=1 Tax=Candidatus Nephthysia bennettiae TaxID=3127016 RepID=UPI0030C6D201
MPIRRHLRPPPQAGGLDAEVRPPHDSQFARGEYNGSPLEYCTNLDAALGCLPVPHQAAVQMGGEGRHRELSLPFPNQGPPAGDRSRPASP